MTANPSAMMKLVALHVPPELRDHMLLVGSLAAAYHYRSALTQDVATKDADIIIQPAGALDACREIAMRLVDLGWVHRVDRERPPGRDSHAPNLPAVRLYPPSSTSYFVELLSMPAPGQVSAVQWQAIQLNSGWYGVPSFRFMSLLELEQQTSEQGIRYASPRMMALANALAHRQVGRDLMSGKIGGRQLLRSAKDLGRILGVAWLEKRTALEAWSEGWADALRVCFPSEWRELAAHAGDGLRELLAREDVLEQAHHSLSYGLLQGKAVTVDMVRAVGEQLVSEVIEPLAVLAENQLVG